MPFLLLCLTRICQWIFLILCLRFRHFWLVALLHFLLLINFFFRTWLLYRSRYATWNCHLNDNRALNNWTMLAGGMSAIFIQLRRLPDLSRTNIWQKFVCIYLETNWIHPMSGVDHFINWAVRINVKWWLLFHFHFLWKQIFINRNKISVHLMQLKISSLNQ